MPSRLLWLEGPLFFFQGPRRPCLLLCYLQICVHGDLSLPWHRTQAVMMSSLHRDIIECKAVQAVSYLEKCFFQTEAERK